MSIFNKVIDRCFPPERKVDARLYEDCLEHMAKMNARIKTLEAEVAGLREEVPTGWNLGTKQDGIIVVWRRAT